MPDLHLEHVPTSASSRAKYPLLFVHGAGQAGWIWEEHFVPFFTSRGWSCFTLDLRGHGASSGADKLMTYRLNDYVDDVRQAIDTVTREESIAPILIAHSLGAALVEQIIDRKLTAISGAVLMSPIVRGKDAFWTTLALVRAFGLVRLLRTVWQRQQSLLWETPELTRRVYFSSSLANELATKYWRRFQAEAWVNTDLLSLAFVRPKSTDVPMLCISGEHDELVPAQAVRAIAHYYDADYVNVQNIAHEMMLDTSWNVAAIAIDSWLHQRFDV